MYRILGLRKDLDCLTEMMCNAWIGLKVDDPYGLPPGLVLEHEETGEYIYMDESEGAYPDGLPRTILEPGEYIDHV